MPINNIIRRLSAITEVSSISWLRYVGVLIWLMTAIPMLLLPWLMPERPPASQIAGWWSAAILYLLVLWHPVIARQRASAFWKRVVVMAVLSVAALGVTHFTHTGLGSLLAMVAAALLPWVLPMLIGVVWVGCLSLAFSVWVIFSPDGGWLLFLVYLLMNLGLTSFPFVASLLALSQVRARAELKRVNSQLVATQVLLTENTRIAERVRISRELHDLVGHHLTALTLNLEVSSHLTEGPALDHINRAASIARLLLSDVREVVSDMRSDDSVNLKTAIETLAEGVPSPEIHVDIPEELSHTDPRRAQVFLRCAQELVTNTVKHARAKNLWISLSVDDRNMTLGARDDGRGSPDLVFGNGINGMRERLRELGGRLDISTSANAGFHVRARLPLEDRE